MVFDLPTYWLAPRKMSMPASVTMNAGMPTYAVQNPCQAPISTPSPSPIRMPRYQGMPQSRMKRATQTPTNAATEPTDRSMWPAMMTRTMPMARIRM